MKTKIVFAAAAVLTGAVLCSPAQAAICGIWPFEKTCPGPGPQAAPPGGAAEAAQAKPRKPLSLRAVAHKGATATRTAERDHATEAKKPAARKVAATRVRHAQVRSRRAGARHFASAKRRSSVVAGNRARRAHARLAAAPAAAENDDDDTPRAATARSERPAATTDGSARSQEEVTALDLAADSPTIVGDNIPAQSVILAQSVPAARTNAEATPPAQPTPAATPAAATASTDATAQPAPAAATSAPLPAPTATTASTPQPEDDTSWLRRIVIGFGGMLTLASAVRLFAG